MSTDLYIGVQVIAIECAESNTLEPRHCSDCYVSYNSKIFNSITDAVMEKSNLVYCLQFTLKKRIDKDFAKGHLGLELMYQSMPAFIDPENHHWAQDTVKRELFDDCNWNLDEYWVK